MKIKHANIEIVWDMLGRGNPLALNPLEFFDLEKYNIWSNSLTLERVRFPSSLVVFVFIVSLSCLLITLSPIRYAITHLYYTFLSRMIIRFFSS